LILAFDFAIVRWGSTIYSHKFAGKLEKEKRLRTRRIEDTHTHPSANPPFTSSSSCCSLLFVVVRLW